AARRGAPRRLHQDGRPGSGSRRGTGTPRHARPPSRGPHPERAVARDAGAGRGRRRAVLRPAAIGRLPAARAGPRRDAGAGHRGRGVASRVDLGVSGGLLRPHLTTVADARHPARSQFVATVVIVALSGTLSARDVPAAPATSIVISRKATPLEVLAAREVR